MLFCWPHRPASFPIKFYIQVNSANHAMFEEWSHKWSQVQLVCDGTTHNDNRLGAIKAIELAVKHFNIHDHLMVVGG